MGLCSGTPNADASNVNHHKGDHHENGMHQREEPEHRRLPGEIELVCAESGDRTEQEEKETGHKLKIDGQYEQQASPLICRGPRPTR